MDKNFKVTNKNQFERMVSFMEQNDAIARGKGQYGMTKQSMTELWAQLTLELNSIGPPTRTCGEWQRVWTHYKANLKRKLAQNKRSFSATGGGPSDEISLNPTEERVSQLIQMDLSINPSGRAFGNSTYSKNTDVICQETAFDSQRTPTSNSNNVICLGPEITPNENCQNECNTCSDNVPTCKSSATALCSITKRQRNSKFIKDSRLDILQQQAQTQKEVLKTLQNIEIAQLEKIDIKKRKLELYEQKSKVQIELYQLKIKIAKAKLAEQENMNTETIYMNSDLFME